MVNRDPNIDVLCREIEAQSQEEAEAILAQARQDAERILQEKQRAADAEKEKILAKARAQASGIQKRILAGVHLEVKRRMLETREALIRRIFEAAEARLHAFRDSHAYRDFLIDAIREGLQAVHADRVRILCGEKERRLLTPEVLHRIEKEWEEHGHPCKIRTEPLETDEGGVLILSEDGRIRFDNRFSARRRRIEDRLRLEAMKRLFEGDR